ncbi:MAG TPA: oxidoreductase [Pseudomonas sp.]|nr:oxidoreductase [Pseudomonas sp.]MBB49842.1 oxidoreductase [Pseudomonadales bacterium]HCA23472.1 oxidoreductase [Pseudomonas sp.]|tara:strand:+ start:1257 stop:1775 length:519 start_codon:yes stop_codon:yes gene_type:complete
MNNLIRLTEHGPERVCTDPWTLALTEEPAADGPRILSLDAWLQRQPEPVLSGQAPSADAVCLQPDDEAEQLQPYLAVLPLIAVLFPSFRDGRGYSQAYLLRTRVGWTGELRAVGDVLRDQLSHMRQCGFDAFAIREDKSAEDAIKGLNGMSVLYGRSAIEPRPLFRRRASEC